MSTESNEKPITPGTTRSGKLYSQGNILQPSNLSTYEISPMDTTTSQPGSSSVLVANKAVSKPTWEKTKNC